MAPHLTGKEGEDEEVEKERGRKLLEQLGPDESGGEGEGWGMREAEGRKGKREEGRKGRRGSGGREGEDQRKVRRRAGERKEGEEKE
eukprot:1017695-Rhodomonas_salina.1